MLHMGVMNDVLSANYSLRAPLVIGIAGGTGSGKTTLAKAIIGGINCPGRVKILSTDYFYKPLTKEQHDRVDEYSFDHPSAIDWDWLVKSLQDLIVGNDTIIPEYDFVTHTRARSNVAFTKSDVIIVEGILLFHEQRIRDLCHLKIFMRVDEDVRLARRLKRDIVERGRTVESVLTQYMRTVKPAFTHFIAPTEEYADFIIPDRPSHSVPVSLLVHAIRVHLQAIDRHQHQIDEM